MNEWVRRSIEFANGPGYLDRLYEVYPIVTGPKRELSLKTREMLREVYEKGDDLTLIRYLLRLPKFPIDDPYVAFLRKKKDAIQHNPETVRRLCRTIRSMGFDSMIRGIERPKVASKKIGSYFKQWLESIYPKLPQHEFDNYRGIAFLQGSNGELKEYANRRLHCELKKGIDLLARVGDKYILGEAKFITDYGGGQKAQFDNALNFLRQKKGEAIRIAVLDGVVWIRSNTAMYKEVCELEETALSALLLKDFLESLK